MPRSPARLARLARIALPALLLAAPAPVAAQDSVRRAVTLDDLYRVKDVGDPQLSPDGAWVAYTVGTPDTAEDRNDSDVWMARWDGSRNVRLTFGKESEHTPRWSPDGRWLAFLSGRGDPDDADQLWLLDRTGGEAQRLSSYKGGVNDYAWSPDGRRLALVVLDPKEDTVVAAGDSLKKKTPRPIVIDRFQFKRDVEGYLGTRRQHLYVFDVESRQGRQLTSGIYDEILPSWSPSGRQLAFVSKRGPDADRSDDWNVFVVDAAGGAPRQLTTFEGEDSGPDWNSRPQWSPDGRSIAYLQGGEPKLIYYALQKLAVIPAAGGAPRLLTASLDRNAGQPRWAPDGRSLFFLLEDDRTVHLARVPAGGGAVERLITGPRVVQGYDVGRDGRIALLTGTAEAPYEVYALGGAAGAKAGARGRSAPAAGALRPLSRQNDDWLATVRLAPVTPTEFTSRDGTRVGGFLVTPAGYRAGARVPAVLRIHGGPVSQFQHEFDFSWQLLAAHGYAVIAANPRGSSGRGEAFSTAIYADWGNKDAQDVLAAVDDAVRRGVADSARLGVGGWSYGGMLTNYTIAQDTRFKAAVSGAGISNILAGYGTDQYVREYEHELGTPWKNPDVWMRVSFPFFKADRIVTPTLFLVGEKDFNVPLLASEQMYQALRSLGRETQLIIYPGQYHGITKPTYERDRLQRYLAWYDRYLKPATVGASSR